MHNCISYTALSLILLLNTLFGNSQFISPRNFYPAAYPLAVRTPHLNAWILTRNGTTSSNSWPMHWTDNSILGMTGYVRIDNTAWQWLGDSPIGKRTTLISTEITPTRTKLTVSAGPCRVNVTFFSPIEPSNWVVQSLPFVYISADVECLDGQPHEIQFYSDISAEWASGDPRQFVQWSTTTSGPSVYHQVSRQSKLAMTEINNIAEDSTVYYAMAQSPSLTWQSSADNDARNQFLKNGRLSNLQDTQFRRINDRFVVFALSTDLGSIVNSTSPTVWSLGVVRDPVVQYRSPSGLQNRSPFYRTQYNTTDDAIDAFVKNYTTVVEEANKLDSRIMGDGDAISAEYGDLLALSTRQAMAGLEITVSSLSENQWNTSDVKAFMKDTGISQRINPVDTLFAAFPFYLYMDAKLGGLLLDPLLESFQFSSANSSGPFFAGPDLGLLYPQALGNSQNNEKMAIENSGNMLIMAFAHAQFSGDGTLIARHYDLLKNWTDYLVEHSLHTTNQVSSDRIAKDNSSNLAIKGILGIAAMSEISEALNRSEDSDMYSANASQLVSQWVDLATEGGHIVSTYGDPSSDGLIYNLYADILLKTKLVPDSVYTGLTTFYDNLIAIQASQNIRFGPSYDSNAAGEGKAPWTLFTAATTTSNTTRDRLIVGAHSRAAFNETAGDNPTTYKTDTGQSFLNYGQASPAQGAMFALLASRLETKPIESPASNQAPTDNSGSGPNRASNAGVIAGAVIGGFVGAALLAMSLLLMWRRRIHRITQEQLKPVPFDPNLLYRQRTTPQIPRTNLAGEEGSHPLPVPVPPPVDTPHRHRPSTSEPYTSPVSHDPSSPTNTSLPDQSQNFSMYSGSQFTSDTSHLRHEIANLRQQMVELQAQQASWTPTPPPRYDNLRDSLMR